MKTITSTGCGTWNKGDVITVHGQHYVITRDPGHTLPRRLRGKADPSIKLRPVDALPTAKANEAKK